MSKVVWFMGASIDGYMEGPDHDISWHMVDAEYHAFVNDYLRTAGGFYEGRTTFELMADDWPTADEDPEAPPEIGDFAEIWRTMRKWVLSTTIESAGWGTEIVRSIDPDAIRALRDELDGDLILPRYGR